MLSAFGLPEPEQLTGLALRFQIAQKLHARSDPHDPPASISNRARDVVDLLLLRERTAADGAPTLAELRAACEAIVAARASDADLLGGEPRTWPCVVAAHSHSATDYSRAAASTGVDVPLHNAVAAVDSWVQEIATAQSNSIARSLDIEQTPGGLLLPHVGKQSGLRVI